jgi:hypothetical protein
MTYHILQRKDGSDASRAAFSEETVAEMIRDKFNERYESEYEVVEEEEALASEIAQAGTIASLEA